MLTALGRFLRKLRIDHNEIMKDMADKLDVSVSFLSAVETGKKPMPSSWNSRICALYSLDDKMIAEFTTAIAETSQNIELNLANAPTDNREIAISFARKFPDFDETELKAIRSILEGGKE